MSSEILEISSDLGFLNNYQFSNVTHLQNYSSISVAFFHGKLAITKARTRSGAEKTRQLFLTRQMVLIFPPNSFFLRLYVSR